MKHKFTKTIIENGILKYFHLEPINKITLNRKFKPFNNGLAIRISSPTLTIGGLKEKGDEKRIISDIFYHPFSGVKDKLTEVSIGDSVKVIGEKAFEHCAMLTTIKGGKALETIQLSAFLGCQSLVEVHLYPTLKTIHPWAFSHCPKLKLVTIHGTIAQFKAIKIDLEAFDEDVMIKTDEGVIYPQKPIHYLEVHKKIKQYLKGIKRVKK